MTNYDIAANHNCDRCKINYESITKKYEKSRTKLIFIDFVCVVKLDEGQKKGQFFFLVNHSLRILNLFLVNMANRHFQRRNEHSGSDTRVLFLNHIKSNYRQRYNINFSN